MNLDVVLTIADRYAQPSSAPASDRAWWHQSLAHGAPGIALLHTELAAAGLRPFCRVHDWLTAAVNDPVTTGTSSGPFYGAPALARVIAGAAAIRPGAYRSALEALLTRITEDAKLRVDHAHTRITARDLPAMAEFDTLRGLVGIGAGLLHHDPSGDALRAVLRYLVQLTHPATLDGKPVPGWWTRTGPTGRDEAEFPGGHGNFGLAHGICGPLALLAQTLRHGIIVDGHVDAITAISAWLDSWRIDTPAGHRWPYMITLDEAVARPTRVRHSGATRRPSWCYGAGGIARSQQLAAIALGDTARRRAAEQALISALTDPAQTGFVTDATLCHGYAGLARIAEHAARDAEPPTASRLRGLAADLMHRAAAQPLTETPGLLEGAAGIGLAALAALSSEPPVTRWENCLLIT